MSCRIGIVKPAFASCISIVKVPDEIIVALVTAACVIGLAIAFKNVSSTAVSMIPFIVYLITRPTVQRFKHETLLWSAVIVLVSAFTLLVHIL